MTIKKWVEFSQEVEVQIDAEDVRCALAEAIQESVKVNRDQHGEEKPDIRTICRTMNSIATFLNAMADEQIEALMPAQRKTIAQFLWKAAGRFAPVEAAKAASSDIPEVA